MTRSILFESIQQSPIDPLLTDCSTESCMLEGYHSGVSEEAPKEPPRETPLMDCTPKLRLIDSGAWVDQLGSGIGGNFGVSVTQHDKNRGILISNDLENICVSPNGLFMDHRGRQFRLSDNPEEIAKIPQVALQLLSDGHATLAAWRSRIVRLSMDTDEYECFLMDDLAPPKTFLVELKNCGVLQSVRIQAGMSYWTTGTGRCVSVPTCILEQETNVKSWIDNIAPELALIDASVIWSDLIQLRAMCLEEDRRLSVASQGQTHASAMGG